MALPVPETSVKAIGRRLHLPVHGSTTLLVELRAPITAHLPFGRTAEVDSIAFSADDPAELQAALRAALAGSATSRLKRPEHQRGGALPAPGAVVP